MLWRVVWMLPLKGLDNWVHIQRGSGQIESFGGLRSIVEFPCKIPIAAACTQVGSLFARFGGVQEHEKPAPSFAVEHQSAEVLHQPRPRFPLRTILHNNSDNKITLRMLHSRSVAVHYTCTQCCEGRVHHEVRAKREWGNQQWLLAYFTVCSNVEIYSGKS